MGRIRAFCTALFAIVLVLLPWTVTSSIFTPIVDDVCKTVACGKGTCKPLNSTLGLGFACECEPGWKQVSPGVDDNDLKFLPCVIPNCSLNSACSVAPSPAQEKENTSFFDPCHWADCGGGTCNKTSMVTHTCECKEGYYNLFNTTIFPCFKECAFGMDCSNLGIGITNSSTSPPSPSLADNSKNKAGSSLGRGGSSWLFTLAIAAALLSC